MIFFKYTIHATHTIHTIPAIYPLRAVARALIGGGGAVYSYIRVMNDEFLLKSVVFKLISKRN